MATTMMMVVSRTRRGGPAIVRLALPSCPPLDPCLCRHMGGTDLGVGKGSMVAQKHSRRNRSA